MKFRKRIRVFPGFTLNLSKSGISSTVGPKGLSVNFNKKGTYLNVGVPGTGLYDRINLGEKREPIPEREIRDPKFEHFQPDYSGEIKSKETSELTSSNFQEFKDSIIQVYKDRNEITNEIAKTEKKISTSKTVNIITKILIIGFITKKFSNKVTENNEYLQDLIEQRLKCFVDVEVGFDEQASKEFASIHEAFKTLMTSKRKWDVTASRKQDVIKTRSSASQLVDRVDISLGFKKISLLKSNFDGIYFENKNGDDIYIYPGFIVILKTNVNLAIIGFNELKFDVSSQLFIESETLPSDSKIVDKTWQYVNKNGQPDRRFSDNPELPVLQYGKFTLESDSGLNEEYMFSNLDAAADFGARLKYFIEK